MIVNRSLSECSQVEPYAHDTGPVLRSACPWCRDVPPCQTGRGRGPLWLLTTLQVLHTTRLLPLPSSCVRPDSSHIRSHIMTCGSSALAVLLTPGYGGPGRSSSLLLPLPELGLIHHAVSLWAGPHALARFMGRACRARSVQARTQVCAQSLQSNHLPVPGACPTQTWWCTRR